MMIVLRPYQEEVKAAVYRHLRQRDDNPCAVVPTAGGKTPIMASICRDAVRWNGRVLVLAHVKELLAQTADKLRVVCPEVDFGIYSAGLKRRDTQKPVIVAGIQSVYKRACELDAFQLLMVDEAHVVPLEGEGMYRQFLSDARVVNPELRIIGFTATPFRLKTGPICTPDGFLNHICYEVGVRELIRDGFLCQLVSKAGKTRADTTGLHVKAGEFVADEVESLMDQEALVQAACVEIVAHTADRNACLIFSSGVKHGRHIVEVLRSQHGIACGFVCCGTPTTDRDLVLRRFKAGDLKYLCNVNVLTTGFDAPGVDCVALLRPTMSPGLYYQMVGRGFRLHPNKENCLVLDFGGNVLRHGPVDDIRITTLDRGNGAAPAKECPRCQVLVAAGVSVCPQCGFQFPAREREKHRAKASEAAILQSQFTTTRYEVREAYYSVHVRRGATAETPRTMRVEYDVGGDLYQSEWICFEHTGYSRWKAEQWWRRRSPDPVPDTAGRAVEIAAGGGLAATKSISVRTLAGEPHARIVGYVVGQVPEAIEVSPAAQDPDAVPF